MSEYIYGKNAVKNAIINNSAKQVYLLSSFKDQGIIELIKEKGLKAKRLENSEFARLVRGGVHQGIAAQIEDYKYLTLDQLLNSVKDKEYPTIAILDGLEDPHNFGAIIRSVDALGIDGIIISSRRQVPVNATVSKVSTGAIEYVKVAMVSNLNQAVEQMKKAGYWIVATDGSAKLDYREIDYKMKTGLIIGSEGFGISQLLLKNSDFVVKIPLVGHVNSLNASVAAALCFQAVYNSKYPFKKEK